MPTSYKVYSNHLDLSHDRLGSTKIDAKDIKSMVQVIHPSFGSYGYGESSLNFIGDYAFTRSTGGRVETYSRSDIERYGFATTWDESGPRFMGWLKAANDNFPNLPANQPIPKNHNVSYAEGITQVRMNFPNPRDTSVDLYITPRIRGDVDFNKEGYYTSKVANIKNELRRLLWNDANHFHLEPELLLEHLYNKGLKLIRAEAPITSIEIIDAPPRTLAAYNPSERTLIIPSDFYERAKEVMSSYGLRSSDAIDAQIRRILYHEIFYHAVLDLAGDDKTHKFIGLSEEEFFSELADNFKTTKWETIYKALANIESDYVKSLSGLRFLQKARARKNLKKSSLEHIAEKYDKRHDNRKGLEEVVEECDNDIVDVVADEKNNVYTMYKGESKNKDGKETYDGRSIGRRVKNYKNEERREANDSKRDISDNTHIESNPNSVEESMASAEAATPNE